MKKRIVIATSVIVDVDCGEHEEDSMESSMIFHDAIALLSSAIGESVERAIQGKAGVVYPRAVSYTQCDNTTNLHFCHLCGGPYTDNENVDMIFGLPIGRMLKGRPTCDNCECWSDPKPNE